MNIDNHYECCLIGEDNFTLACAKVLVKSGFIIKFICSDNFNLINWANENNILVCPSYIVFEKKILEEGCDFLFSILNSKILSNQVLNGARILAINFHNAYLPRYAGSNAVNWSILRGELEHGVTWHKMSEKIDLGSIIKQTIVPIETSETAISLNVKCTEYGLKLFEEMLIDFKKGKCVLKDQNTALRLYFSKAAKPKGNALINWFDTAEALSCLFRACNYAPYNNEFAVPKIGLNNHIDYILVKQLKVTEMQSNLLPGTIVNIINNTMTITTGSYDVVLSDFFDLSGNSLSISQIENIYGMTVQSLLPHYEEELVNHLQLASESCFYQEKNWVEKCTTAKLPQVPFMPPLLNTASFKYKTIATFNVELPIIKKWHELTGISLSKITFCLIIIYLQRINNYEVFDIGLSGNMEDNVFLDKKIENLFFNFSWLKCNFDPEKSFEEFLIQFSLRINEKKYSSNCLKDILLRYAALQEKYTVPNIIIVLDSHNMHNIIHTGLLIKIHECQIMLYLGEFEQKIQEDQLYMIESMEYRIKMMVQGLEKNRQLPICQLPLLNEYGVNLYIDSWSHSEPRAIPEKEMIQIFEEQVVINPSKKAIIHNNVSITYEELNRHANYLAKQLLDMNVTPGEHIGIISLSRIETIIALLATLKIKGVYIPIDPDYPDSYLSYILNDTKPKIIFSSFFSSARFEKFIKKNHPEILFLPFAYFSHIEVFPNITITEKCNELAYIMYTSGSTGKPKGVPINQSAILRLVMDNNFLEIKPEYHIAQASNLSFDASTFEIWGALLNGCTLVCIEKAVVLDPIKFKKALKTSKVDILWVTASLFDRLVQNDPSIFNSVQYLLAGGDVVNSHTVKKVFENSTTNKSNIKLFINGYGPTENTTFTTVYSIKPTDTIDENIPIGKPIANTYVYVLDKYLQPVYAGIPGELFIAGSGLTPGYIGQQEKNEDRFIETALITGKIQRYFKTGDYVKWLSDGNLAYIGRKDSQVKLRGFRVEMNAINNVLLKHPDISQCYTMIIDSTKLYVYIVSEHHSNLEKSQVLKYMKAQLPHYMIPSEIVFLEQFPLTPNGKVDSVLIKNLTISRKKRLIKNPVNDIEAFLVKLWKSILNVDEISTEDNFFEVGGNSLMIASLIYKIYQKFNKKLMISDFLIEPTISSLANLITGNSRRPQENNSFFNDLILNPISEEKVFPLSKNKKNGKKKILVTGATGFLGAFLVEELLKDKNNKIYCHVRSSSHDEAKEKLKRNFEKWQISLELMDKIYVLHGDLAEKNLGLSENRYQQLAEEVDEIFHLAAQVNHIYNYTQLRDSNVIATLNLSKMVSFNKNIQFNYISTISAASEHVDEKNRIMETFISGAFPPKKTMDGYSLTKWVSETMLYKMYHCGFKIKIFRPAWISGSSKTGVMPLLNNHLYLVLKGCAQLGFAPMWDTRINMTPVDKLAQMIIEGAKMNKNVFNLINNETISWINYIQAANNFGYHMKLIDPQQWYNLVAKIDKNNALFPLLSIYTDPNNQNWLLKQNYISDACNDNYLSIKEKISDTIVWDEFFLEKYFQYIFFNDRENKK